MGAVAQIRDLDSAPKDKYDIAQDFFRLSRRVSERGMSVLEARD
jgi:hypothetical protein